MRQSKKEFRTMIIQTAGEGEPRLAVMMYEHTALSEQFARAFGNERFESIWPHELMFYIIGNHDAGWADFDRDPATDANTGLPYNLVETPAQYITVTSRRSPDFNERHHPFCGLMSSMHSWGLYNGRYGLSRMVLIDKIPGTDRPLADRMLADEIARQKRLKAELGANSEAAAWIEAKHLLQNYKQLQFCDTLALYFHRIHPKQRGNEVFVHVPVNAAQDVDITVTPQAAGVYELSPFPFAASGAEFAFAGRLISADKKRDGGSWTPILQAAPTRWESFRLVAG
jgi:hypothetical protein